VNFAHRWLCSSSRWKQAVAQYVLPWTLEGLDLGAEVLEVGPGYGAATDLLRGRVTELTCVEIDFKLAESLRRRTLNQNVTVLCGDATKMSFPNARFDTVVCFTMLHHIASTKLQDQLLEEVMRILRPGGIFAGTDSVDSRFFRFLHVFDTLVVIDPGTLPDRLAAAGFENVQVDVNFYAFRFRARKPSENGTKRCAASPEGQCLKSACRIWREAEGWRGIGKRRERLCVSNPVLPVRRFVPWPKESTCCTCRYKSVLLQLRGWFQRNPLVSRSVLTIHLLLAARYRVPASRHGLLFPSRE